MIKWTILLGFIIVATSTSVSAPQILVQNSFVREFVTYEILNILAIILTVTLASVANIHISLNRLMKSLFSTNSRLGEEMTAAVRTEINQNAWMLIALFVACCIILFIKGAIADGSHIEALLNGLALAILLANILTLYDIYAVIYRIVKAEGSSSTRADEKSHADEKPD